MLQVDVRKGGDVKGSVYVTVTSSRLSGALRMLCAQIHMAGI